MTALPPNPAPDTPSARRLLKSTAIAAGVAAVVLVVFVLPAEYGVDPTGIGRVLGLTAMGETKMRLAAEAAAQDDESAASTTSGTAPVTSSTPAPPPRASGRSDTTDVVIAPGQGREIKLVMRKDARAEYVWSANRGVVNYDTHADAPGIRYHNYTKGTGVRADSGSLTAAFEGQHGWFWRNRGADTVTVTLRTRGDYQDIKRIQ